MFWTVEVLDLSGLSAGPTFYCDDMLPNLVLQHRLLDPLQQLVDGVDVRMDGLEPLDLGADGGRVGLMLLVVHAGRDLPVARKQKLAVRAGDLWWDGTVEAPGRPGSQLLDPHQEHNLLSAWCTCFII